MARQKSTPKKISPPSKKKIVPQFCQQGEECKVNMGTLRAIKNKLQSTTNFCIPRLTLAKLIREILMKNYKPDYKIQIKALRALQEASEIYLTYFQDANRTHCRQRITLFRKDMYLVLDVKGYRY